MAENKPEQDAVASALQNVGGSESVKAHSVVSGTGPLLLLGGVPNRLRTLVAVCRNGVRPKIPLVKDHPGLPTIRSVSFI